MSGIPSRREEVPAPLARLARLRGVSLSYTDAWGHEQQVGRETLVGVLQALGEAISRAEDAPAALAAHDARSRCSEAGTEPAIVAWDGLIGGESDRDVRYVEGVVLCEDGGEVAIGPHTTPLPPGVHTLRHPEGGEKLVISSPRQVRPLPDRSWGVFAPTYAIRDGRPVPHGDLTSLESLGTLVAGAGARYLVTLPLLARGHSSSPYSPISRAFWEPDFLDLRRVPEIEAEARSLDPAATATSPDAAALLALGAERIASPRAPRRDAYERYRRERPDVAAFAQFVAMHQVPASQPDETSQVFAQWAVDEQLREVSSSLTAAGIGLVLDLPVGCRPDGYDPWAYPGSFGTGATIGAPPDDFFSAGQNWGLAPLHPHGERTAGYPVVRAALAHLMRHAEVVRIDHVAGWQRLWWIPEGAPAAEGAYVAYKSEEMAALACLAAWRSASSLVGEDLGTVDPAVRALLSVHQIAGMDVSVFDLAAAPAAPLRTKHGSMAMLDTHDTATVAGWLAGDDLVLRHRLGLIDQDGLSSSLAQRRDGVAELYTRLRAEGRLSDGMVGAAGAGAADPSGGDEPRSEQVAAALLEELGESKAAVVIVNLEDLWGEPDPQNVPGTVTEHLNFARPMALTVDEIASDPRVADSLARLDRARARTPARTPVGAGAQEITGALS